MDILPDREYVVSGLRTDRKHEGSLIIPVMQRKLETYFFCELEGWKVIGLRQIIPREAGEPAEPMVLLGTAVLAIRRAFVELYGIQNALSDDKLAATSSKEAPITTTDLPVAPRRLTKVAC